MIDRLLILHSGQPQEEGGASSTIWSHFSPFNDPVIIGDYRFEHYTMASVHGGLGVTVHEMLHQMGAVDLYDVHSESPTKTWYGLGDWDIMASGNWIGDGENKIYDEGIDSQNSTGVGCWIEESCANGVFDPDGRLKGCPRPGVVG